MKTTSNKGFTMLKLTFAAVIVGMLAACSSISGDRPISSSDTTTMGGYPALSYGNTKEDRLAPWGGGGE